MQSSRSDRPWLIPVGALGIVAVLIILSRWFDAGQGMSARFAPATPAPLGSALYYVNGPALARVEITYQKRGLMGISTTTEQATVPWSTTTDFLANQLLSVSAKRLTGDGPISCEIRLDPAQPAQATQQDATAVQCQMFAPTPASK